VELLRAASEDEVVAALWVYCASGFRASIATSLLERAGRSVVLIDDDFVNADRLGLVVHHAGG